MGRSRRAKARERRCRRQWAREAGPCGTFFPLAPSPSRNPGPDGPFPASLSLTDSPSPATVVPTVNRVSRLLPELCLQQARLSVSLPHSRASFCYRINPHAPAGTRGPPVRTPACFSGPALTSHLRPCAGLCGSVRSPLPQRSCLHLLFARTSFQDLGPESRVLTHTHTHTQHSLSPACSLTGPGIELAI